MASGDWPEHVKKLQQFCEGLSPLKKAATELYEAAVEKLNSAYEEYQKAGRQRSCAEAELHLLRRLEALVIERRAMEPRHSHPDHDCVECEILGDLAAIRREKSC